MCNLPIAIEEPVASLNKSSIGGGILLTLIKLVSKRRLNGDEREAASECNCRRPVGISRGYHYFSPIPAFVLSFSPIRRSVGREQRWYGGMRNDVFRIIKRERVRARRSPYNDSLTSLIYLN